MVHGPHDFPRTPMNTHHFQNRAQMANPLLHRTRAKANPILVQMSLFPILGRNLGLLQALPLAQGQSWR
jgi:hypothetical protein